MSKIKEIVAIADGLRKLADELVALFDAQEESVHFAKDMPPTLPVQDATLHKPVQPAGEGQALQKPIEPVQENLAPTMTLEELRAFVSAYSSMENRPKIKAILTKFGVNKLTELDPSKYEALKKEVAAI